MWHCEAARTIWRQLRDSWERIGVLLGLSDDEFCEDVFSLTLRQTPPAVWALLGLRGVDPELIQLVHPLVELVWQQHVLGCFQQIWRWRQGVDDEALPWTAAVASSALRGSFRAPYQQASSTLVPSNPYANPLRSMLHGLQRLQIAAEVPAHRRLRQAQDQYLLFFDGGSRGNPGAGGSDAVMVRVDAFGGQPCIIWAAAMSLASPTTTNNQAEYHGLVTGLRRAAQRQLQPLTVIGDSAMIISMCKSPTLSHTYTVSSLLP